jgi:acyl-CoA thioesterase-1
VEGPARSSRPRVVFLGDSITAGLGVSPAEAYPGILERRMHDAGLDYEVVNAGVSGDTSAGALRRVDWSLEGDARVLVVAIGGNDGLRGLPASALKQNLDAIIAAAERRHVAVLLAGMEAPPNFGEAYTREFRTAYRDVARRRRVRFLPFILDGVAGRPALNQADGIHPNAEGHRLVADLVWRELEPMLNPRPPS